MKKAMAALLCATMVFSLCGCGSSADPAEGTDTADNAETPAEGEAPAEGEEAEEGDEAPASDDGREVITLCRSDDGNGAVEALIEGFEASQDKYKVEWVVPSSDSDQNKTMLNTAFSAGSSEYDVVAIDVVWAGDMAAAGYIEPLDSYMKDAGRSPADYNKGSIQSGTYSAKTYALPLYPDFGILYFRSDIVSEDDAAKLRSGDYTWADLQAMAETYAGQEGTSTGFAFQANQSEALICNVNEFTSGFTSVKDGLEAMKNMVDSDSVPDDVLVYLESETANSYVNGETVFARNWPYMWGSLAEGSAVTQDQTDIAPLPGGSCIGGWLLAMSAFSEKKEGAWALIDYMTSEEGQKIFCSVGGYVPGYNGVEEDAGVKEANQLLSKEGFVNAMGNTLARPSSDNYEKLSDALQIAIHSYLSGSAELDATATEVEDLLNQ